MTKIYFKKTGGMLGREVATEIDLNEVPGDVAQELMRLVSETNFFDIPQNLIAQAEADEYQYTITVEASNSHHTVQTSDTNAPESLHPLLETLSALAESADRS